MGERVLVERLGVEEVLVLVAAGAGLEGDCEFLLEHDYSIGDT